MCAHVGGRDAVRRNGISRYVPAYRTIESAIQELPPVGTKNANSNLYNTIEVG